MFLSLCSTIIRTINHSNRLIIKPWQTYFKSVCCIVLPVFQLHESKSKQYYVVLRTCYTNNWFPAWKTSFCLSQKSDPAKLKNRHSTELIWYWCIVFAGRVKDRRALEMRASTLRGDMRMLRAELSQLKQFQTFQAQQFQEMIRNAKEQIVQRVTRINNGNHVCLHSLFVTY